MMLLSRKRLKKYTLKYCTEKNYASNSNTGTFLGQETLVKGTTAALEILVYKFLISISNLSKTKNVYNSHITLST